jgi:hypothetical protein
MATLCQVKPALQLLEQLSGGESTAWSNIVNIFLASAKRSAAIEKPPVQCAEGRQSTRGHHVPSVSGLFPPCGEVRDS